MTDLRKAAQEVLDRWDSPAWDWHKQGPTADLMTALRAALEEPVEPTTAWAHLPNARHIDRILAHVKEHPDKWDAAWVASLGATLTDWAASRAAAANASRGAAREAVWAAARGATWDAFRGAARDAILALVAWDEAGDLLSQPIEVVKARADEGNHAALLLYPAMLAMQENNQ